MSRKFGESVPDGPAREPQLSSSSELIRFLRSDEIGSEMSIRGPFGWRKIIYCDYTASARAFSTIENYIQQEVLPFYGNTHSSVTFTAEQTTLFMHEARQEIRALTGAGDLDDVIFTGSGSTAAVELLLHLMNIEENTHVIHSIQEHHSNLLPWRNATRRCHVVGEDASGRIDVDDVARVAKRVRDENPTSRIVAALTACSNLTGIRSDVVAITRILRKFNVISIWDYASAAPYTSISVNGDEPLDAVFFSGHKFPGGVGSPGVLIVKKSLIAAESPKRHGGGTVFFVNADRQWYLKEAEHREEGGTGDAVGAVRLAMALKLKRSIGVERIEELERELVQMMVERLDRMSNLVVLGARTTTRRSATFSFLVRCRATRQFFHHNYIAALLNDAFGIQTRAGCMCAGPYAHRLLGIDAATSTRIVDALREDGGLDRTHLRRHAEYSQREFLRPGFTRISFPYFFGPRRLSKILDCLEFVAENAGRFLHLYQVNCETGEWHHQNQRVFHGRRWLGYAKFTANGIVTKEMENEAGPDLDELLEHFKKLEVPVELSKIPDGRLAIGKEYEDLRWFVLPIELAEKAVSTSNCIIRPLEYERVDEEEPIGGRVENEDPEDQEEEEQEQEELDEAPTCPLTRPKGIPGEIGDESEAREVRLTEDWNRRVVVRRVDGKRNEEAWHQPPLEMYKKMTDVIHELQMIKNGDKVLVCLSGGKDSLSLLHLLHFYQQRCQKARSTSFDLGAITIDPGSAEYNPRPLIDYCRRLNIDYFYEEQDIIGAAKRVGGLRSICAFCSRMKRGRLAAAAQHHGWNVLAMGQHLDDLAESFFIAAFQNGNLSTMKAQYETKDGALRVIRPLVFIREKALRTFAEEKKLPVVAENCPACFNQATERHRIKQMLAQQELVFPELFNSLRSALRPLLLVDSAHTSEMRQQAIRNIIINR
ncbi:unnamed protein product [Caenorhabditis bovis]|uniref:Aminotransferase class V domain-containing protein n=1 Tax=Caenorhabditis bovis TaxID=2654633 RepID=A0A8S1ENV7_9PELO|nr:unnamed protein product [Caenorhabditis bovis]